MKLVKEKVLPLIMTALAEDIGCGDITVAIVFEKDTRSRADIVAKEDCVIAGIDVAGWVFKALDERMRSVALCKDGDSVSKGEKVMHLKGPLKSMLAGERVALNFLSRLSGVATLTARFVAKTKGTRALILDTRKTMPGMRLLDKYAVSAGGGYNHRMGLWDGVLIKDNHLDSLQLTVNSSRVRVIIDSVKKAKVKGYKNVEIEVDNLKEFKAALDAGADIIMLDNMKPVQIKKAVQLGRLRHSDVLLEVSGGVNIDNVHSIAKTGVDRISIGLLTHSAPSVDFSLELCK
ncbi:MAG: carboxylating nicotinate-nucleotide diphosphorylase [Candidatus Omnitrophica bacterium]|nr:carboxylating nicotinate-nucleotide diphosphorylase [Candidatus Omnitrophota bacterium]